MSLEAVAWVMGHSPYRGQHPEFTIHLYVADAAARMDGVTMEAPITPERLSQRACVSLAMIESFVQDATRRGLLRHIADGGSYVACGGTLKAGQEVYEFYVTDEVAA